MTLSSDEDAPCGELVPLTRARADDRPSVERVAAIVLISRATFARGGVVPAATRTLTRRAICRLGPRGWWRLWQALRESTILRRETG
jgi:hypothetical protein